ncbi:hypothetical protein ACFQJD_14265 [Haloplanus sp. GCM10025708]|uniref:hypothetical protein n=1 Tax=Haloplanus sp. GCM10025708 TaxID=3252679 RepID=UPI00360B8190
MVVPSSYNWTPIEVPLAFFTVAPTVVPFTLETFALTYTVWPSVAVLITFPWAFCTETFAVAADAGATSGDPRLARRPA